MPPGLRLAVKPAATPRPVTRQTRTRRRAAHWRSHFYYGDGSTQDANPDGVGYYTHSTMAGFIRLEPRDLDEDPTNLTVTLSMPKQYVEKDSIRIPPFSTNSTITEYTIGSVEENGENYTISIYFTVYDRTQTLMLPFTLSFLDDVVPDNYRLPVTASVSGGDAAAPTIYRPLYKDWEIQKFVNSNRLDAFGKDGAEVVVTPQEEGGNPYLDDLTYVDFAFIVNKYTNDQCSLADLRDARSVTLTDTLPTYTDRNGVSRIAVFDADQNPGWTLSEDGKTISRTYTGEHSAEILLQIYNDALHLRFPGLQFTALADDGTLMAELSNSVALTAIPSGEAPGETHPEADDPLRFRLTTDPTAQGKFTKGAEKGDIYDVEVYKTNPYPWSLALSNDKSQPLRHIVIQDRTIVEDGETNDKIAYAFSDATIIAAQSMYAEKFIAPAGSDSWSKQGLLVKAGSGFDYLLEIVNETAAVHTGLTVYDTLPRIGDPNLFGASGLLRIPGPPARRHHAAGGLYGLLHHERRCLHPFHGGDGERRYLGSHSLRLRVRHRLQARRRGRDRAGRELKIPGPDPGMRAEDL